MRTICPACSHPDTVSLGFAGLVACKCGVRYDGFAHPQKEKPRSTRGAISTSVSFVEIPRGATAQPRVRFRLPVFAFSARSRKLAIAASLVAVAAATLFICYRLSTSGTFSTSSRFAKPTNVAAMPVVINDASKITLSDVEFSAVAPHTYFLHVSLTNTGKQVVDWPLIEVTFIMGGKDVAQKLVPPIEYLAGQVASGKTPPPSLLPAQVTPVWMNLTVPDNVGPAEDYRIRPLYRSGK